jgi:hypothetical protein
MRRPHLPAIILVATILVSACSSTQGGGAPGATAASAGSSPGASAAAASVVPVIISSQQVVGENRFVFSFLDAKTNLPAASPDRQASVAFIAPGATQPGAPVPGTFVWAIEGSRGEYISHATFPAAGDWKAVFITQATGKPQEAIGVSFQVLDKSTVIAVGDKAPASKTPTLADVGGDVRQISSDPNPDPSFYQVSVDTALARHTPFVLVFATPAFCTSAQCGPTLDKVKAIKATSPASVAFINVEPYVLKYANGKLQPVLDASNQLQPVQATIDWGLLSEPWIFTVDRNGVVQGSFEGVVSDAELTAAIAQIAGS